MDPTTAAIYSRISHDPEGRQAGVERQEVDCRRMAADRGWVVLEPVYRENDTSASTRSKKARPVFEQLLQDVAAGGVDVLVAYSTSRLTRRPLEYERLIELTARTGLDIQTVVSGPVQLGTADGRAIARVLAVIDAAEAERMSERVTRAKLQRAELGLWHGGPFTPFGYRYAPSSTGRGLDLVVDDARAKLVREACRRVIRGDSLAGISRDWSTRGLVTTTGAPWRPQGIRKMLVRPSTAGLTERRGQLYPGMWPAILRRRDWEAARTILTDPRRDTRRFRKVAKRHALAGLLVCGRCDRLLVSNPLRGVPSFICSPSANGGCAKIRIQADHVERFLLEQIKERDAAGLESDGQARLRVSLRQLQDDHYDGLLDRADYLRQSQRLRSLLEARGGTTTSYDDLNDGDKRAVIRRALDRVVVLPHPAGLATSHLDWPQREAVLNVRLHLLWN
jgi:DNA invertase Pin-like site-specific DNA recombinase